MQDLEEKLLTEEKLRMTLENNSEETSQTAAERTSTQKDAEISSLFTEISELRNENCSLLDSKKFLEDEIIQLKVIFNNA